MSVLRLLSSAVPRAARSHASSRMLAVARASNCALIRPHALQRPLAASASAPAQTLRFYSDGPAPLTPEFIYERISGVLSNCDKIDPAKITPEARLEEDLGLDSLDVVDALFYVEEEFTVQMPDHEADGLKTVKDVVDWVSKQPDAF